MSIPVVFSFFQLLATHLLPSLTAISREYPHQQRPAPRSALSITLGVILAMLRRAATTQIERKSPFRPLFNRATIIANNQIADIAPCSLIYSSQYAAVRPRKAANRQSSTRLQTTLIPCVLNQLDHQRRTTACRFKCWYHPANAQCP